MIVVFLFRPLFLNFANHIFRVLSPHRPLISRTEYIMTFDNKCAQITFTFMHSLQNLSPSSKNSKVWQVLGGLFTHLPPTPNTRWPPKPPSWCTRFKGGIQGSALALAPQSGKDEEVEGRLALQAGLDGDQPAADCTPSCHCIAGHYQGDATSLGEGTPPRTDSSNNDDVCCRLLLGILGKITMLRDPSSTPPLMGIFLIFTQFFLLVE